MTNFLHIGLFYGDRREYLDGTMEYIRAGVSAGEPVMVAVPTDNLKVLRGELGELDGDAVRTFDMTIAGRNPGRILPAVLLAFADAHPGRRVRIVGEPIWAGRSVHEYPACVQHEALINAAFADREASILCPYDVATLPQIALDDARRTHPVLEAFGRRTGSSDYADPLALAAEFNAPLPPRPPDAGSRAVGREDLPMLRAFVAAEGASAGLSAARIADLVLAVNELATNTIVHAGATGSVALWAEGGQIVCEVGDEGRLDDPLAGRLRVPVDQPGGRGLVLVQQVCDLVRVYAGPDGTTIRIYIGR
ncbi:MAG: sensor histidine kinase [Hamadaea sp.]|nr:sensor histidine kinase [Hamadaea sp.]